MAQIWDRFQAAILGLLGVATVVVTWDLYKAFGPAEGVLVGDTRVLPRTTERAMPHSWDMLQRLGEPVSALPDAPDAVRAVWDASMFSLGLAARGWVIGVVIGLLLALAMSGFRIVESALLPWVILSQTVPLIAIAPLVRRWGSELQIGGHVWSSEDSVAVIAAYLAFFPVAVGALRGLKSPDKTHLELMRAYGIGWWRTLVTLRLPSSVPYLLPALRLAAASAVIGAVVAEVSIGLKGGLGRMVIDYAVAASGDPAKPWAPIFGAIGIGLVAAGAVGLLGLALRPFRLTGVSR
ncbi:ABC transporter permease subunit [Nocardioides humilatus]|uniref:ABC transporter permease subunit n=1 Tax=Nocardioides humilatus TaxID=2607660 RepID=A0A5B1LKS4_9ACTN|nr:ABC transporter permease subunit [Nocardioides humilatus]KAA1420217.1 ABC transporter permease subunit [Nocardioides humilatus]